MSHGIINYFQGAVLLMLLFIIKALSQTNFWEPTGGPAGAFVNTITMTSTERLLIGTGKGIFYSDDLGETWIPSNKGLTNTDVQKMKIIPGGEIIAGTGGGIFISGDGGENWKLFDEGLSQYRITSLAIRKDNQVFAGVVDTTYGLEGHVFFNQIGENHWVEIDSGFIADDVVRDFLIDENENIYVSTNGGGVLQRDVLYRFTASDSNWVQVYWFAPVFTIKAMHLHSSGLFFAASDIGMLRSSDQGLTWDPADLFREIIFALEEDSRGTIYAGTAYHGAFFSSDSGSSWTNIVSGLSNPNILSLEIGPDQRIYAGTYGDGVYRSVNPIVTLSHDNETDLSATHFYLEQNFPNPFNPSTVISFNLSRKSRVKLLISDTSGRVVSVLVNKPLPAGHYDYRWNASDFSSGIYFYSMQAGSFRQTRKMVLVH
jgi:ligand-binding sensor domain-containing protein